jgi:PAS domain-containing protein
MLDSFNLTRRSIVVFAVTAALALAGGAFEQAALRGQRRHYEAIGALALHRQLAVRLVRGTLLAAPAAPHGAEAGQGDAATLARHRADVAEARARLALASRILVAPDDAPENATGGTSSRALRDAAGPRASLIAAAIDTLLATATRAGAPDAGRASVEALLAAERDLLSVTIERTRAVLATTDREIAELRLAAGGVGVLLLGSLAGGLFLLVHPAARAIEAATHEATRGREFASSLVASAADAIVAFDARMRITEWNPAMERWTGVGRADALGRSPADIPAAFDWTADGPPYARALAGEATALVDVPGRAHPDARPATSTSPARRCATPRAP